MPISSAISGMRSCRDCSRTGLPPIAVENISGGTVAIGMLPTPSAVGYGKLPPRCGELTKKRDLIGASRMPCGVQYALFEKAARFCPQPLLVVGDAPHGVRVCNNGACCQSE